MFVYVFILKSKFLSISLVSRAFLLFPLQFPQTVKHFNVPKATGRPMQLIIKMFMIPRQSKTRQEHYHSHRKYGVIRWEVLLKATNKCPV